MKRKLEFTKNEAKRFQCLLNFSEQILSLLLFICISKLNIQQFWSFYQYNYGSILILCIVCRNWSLHDDNSAISTTNTNNKFIETVTAVGRTASGTSSSRFSEASVGEMHTIVNFIAFISHKSQSDKVVEPHDGPLPLVQCLKIFDRTGNNFIEKK